ncbi:MAG: hypothetical protein AB1491_00125 [Thermodesulfobacteriota bacterium]
MADVAATVTILERDFTDFNKETLAQAAFGNGTDNYPSGGIPLGDKSRFGMHKKVKRVFVEQPIDGYFYKIDYSNEADIRLRIFQACLDLKFIDGSGGASLGVDVANAELEVNNTGGKTILGADAATKGGVLPGPLAEVPTSHKPPATVVKFEIKGV